MLQLNIGRLFYSGYFPTKLKVMQPAFAAQATTIFSDPVGPKGMFLYVANSVSTESSLTTGFLMWMFHLGCLWPEPIIMLDH